MTPKPLLIWVFIAMGILIVGCSDDEDTDSSADVGDVATSSDSDAASDEDMARDMAGPPRWSRPVNHASLVFAVDDRANRTFHDGEMVWSAGFRYDEATNVVSAVEDWLPESGVYPRLYDDGPYTTGGHEAEGEVAGDHIFSVEVFVNTDADADLTLQYGLLDENEHWIWLGPVGEVIVPAHSTDRHEAVGLAFKPFGRIDLRIDVDTNALHGDFNTIDPSSDAMFVRGAMSSWTPVQLHDDGLNGDLVANDGTFTFVLSEYLGTHDGLLNRDTEVQFILSFNSADGREYRTGSANTALTNGLSAFSDWASEGVWAAEELLLLTNAFATASNTGVVIGPDGQ